LFKRASIPGEKIPSSKIKVNSQSEQDGQIISMKKIQVPGLDPSLQAYRLMYWSDKNKLEAYVAAPKGPGTYSLFIVCHGGWTVPLDKSHIVEMVNGAEILHFNASGLIGHSAKNLITVAPLYRGYGNSTGKVRGIYENTMDTENAIKAVIHYFNNKKENRHIQDRLYLSGVSMGGAVVLKVAAERKDIYSVVAISPFVGWNLFGTWAHSHMDNDKWSSFFYSGEEAYGRFDPQYEIYKKQSVAFEKITAPALLIQGTADDKAPWEPVKILYEKMAQNHQDVTFKLIDGGNHGLTNKTDVLNPILYEWYSAH